MSTPDSQHVHPGIRRIGRVVSEYRREKGLTQQELSKKLGHNDRNVITQLEQGRRLPHADEMEQLGQLLEIPDSQWQVLSHGHYLQMSEFENALSELLGKPLSHESLDLVSQGMLIQAVNVYISGPAMTLAQAHDHFNTLMTFYGERSVSLAFYRRFLGQSHFQNVDQFAQRVHDFQKAAIRIYGSFRKAFKTLSVCEQTELEAELSPLREVDLSAYKERRPFDSIRLIPQDRLDDLGYISVERVRAENKDRHTVSNMLKDLAQWYLQNPHRSYDDKKLKRIETLLRKFDSNLQIEDTLFKKVDPDEILREAQRLTPEDQELMRIAQTQEQGQQNLAAYLTEAYMDLYIATSMRERADFISVHRFVETIFNDPQIAELKLRYFNPTQSWIEDRVAKGLVEALMLRRASMTIYMAQKTDTFGKDSEASVALGQGKPVIVYVPRLFVAAYGINSEALMQSGEAQLAEQLRALGFEIQDGLDKTALVRELLRVQLQQLQPSEIAHLLELHWADFDIYGEMKSFPDELRHPVTLYLDALTQRESESERPEPEPEILPVLIEKLVQQALDFEKRAKTFKEIHPLALQVILSSGVLNGILVVRSAESCTRIMYQLFKNTLETELKVEDHNYRLIEKHTGSTLRVISKNKLLTNAFWTQYFS